MDRSKVRSPEPSQIVTALGTARPGIMERCRGVPRRGEFDDSTVFDRSSNEPCAAIRLLRARSEQAGTSIGEHQGPIDATGELQSTNAAADPQSGTASQATESHQYPPNDLSSRPSITGTAHDGQKGSPEHSATSTRKPWIPGGGSSMQNLRMKWHRSQVGTDQQSQSRDSVKSGFSVQSGKSNPSAWFGRVKRFGRMGKIRDRTVRRTAAMDEFIKSGHEMYEGT
jgi:hypothetical protein